MADPHPDFVESELSKDMQNIDITAPTFAHTSKNEPVPPRHSPYTTKLDVEIMAVQVVKCAVRAIFIKYPRTPASQTWCSVLVAMANYRVQKPFWYEMAIKEAADAVYEMAVQSSWLNIAEATGEIYQ
jgi:hypothetical protein